MSIENPDIPPEGQRLGPYIHPDYWDGHIFGQGDLEKVKLGFTPPYQRSFARKTLQEYLDQPGGRMGLETYVPGDTFNPNDHASGTIVAYRQEGLKSYGLKAAVDLGGIQPATVVDNLPASKNLSGHALYEQAKAGADARITYMSSLVWGVVARTTRKSRGVVVQIYPEHIDGVPPEAKRRTVFDVFSRFATASGVA